MVGGRVTVTPVDVKAAQQARADAEAVADVPVDGMVAGLVGVADGVVTPGGAR